MRQLSLHSMFASKSIEDATSGESLECYDLFCGCGGWSTGAVQAGHKVVFACDNDEQALLAHAANHPNTTHRRLQLPHDAVPFPTDGRRFHCHGSPPCTQFSSMRTKRDNDAPDADAEAVRLVEWYLETALSCGATSWTMEQVAAPAVLKLVKRVRQNHLHRVDYDVFQLRDLGVPQTRRRLLVGSPHIIARLRRSAMSASKRSVRDVVAAPRGTHVRSSLRWEKKTLRANRQPGESKYLYKLSSNPLHACRPIDDAAPTVVTGGVLMWAGAHDSSSSTSACLTPKECAALQTFPPDYHLPDPARTAHRLVGNAVPPLVAKLMMTTLPPARCTSPSLRRTAPEPVWK